MKTKSELIEEVTARDELGNEYSVLVYQEFLESTAMNRPPSWVPGLKEMRLEDGTFVNFIDDNTFEIVGRPSTIIKRI